MTSWNQSESPEQTDNNSAQYSSGFLLILPVILAVIVFGNVLLLLAIMLARVRRVPDLLVGSLAVIDILNGLGPVVMSIVVFQLNPGGFRNLDMDALCQFYNWMSSFLCLSASFLATLMALDCACATLRPVYYRTKITCSSVSKLIFYAGLSVAFISSWPAIGWGHVFPHRGICSFDFGGSFALMIAILGYVQLLVVLTSFIAVSRKMTKYGNRLGRLRLGRTLTFEDGRLQAMVMTPRRTMKGVQCNGETLEINHNRQPTKIAFHERNDRSNLGFAEQHQKPSEFNARVSDINRRNKTNPRSHQKPRTNRHLRESRQFIKILGSAVFLFYLSWLPIILSITLELATRQHREVLQSLSAQMSLMNSILNPWVYCALSRPYRRAYISVLRRVGRVCGVGQATPGEVVRIGDVSSRFMTSARRIFPDNR